MPDNDAYPEYPAIPCIKAAVSVLDFVIYAEREAGDEFGVGDSLGQPLAMLKSLLQKMEDREL